MREPQKSRLRSAETKDDKDCRAAERPQQWESWLARRNSYVSKGWTDGQFGGRNGK